MKSVFILTIILLILLMVQQKSEHFGPDIAGTKMWKGVHAGGTILFGAVYNYPTEVIL